MTLASLASSNSPRVACSAASREQLARGCWQGLTHRDLIYCSASDLTPRSSLTKVCFCLKGGYVTTTEIIHVSQNDEKSRRARMWVRHTVSRMELVRTK